MIMSIKLQAVGLALIAFTGCASPSDRLYQEAMARYYIIRPSRLVAVWFRRMK